MTGPEISALVGAGVALITAAASYLRSVAAHNAAKAANAKAVMAMAQTKPRGTD